METAAERLGDEDESLPTDTGTITQLTDETPPVKGRRRKKRKRRPIGFQLGDLGHLDRLEDAD